MKIENLEKNSVTILTFKKKNQKSKSEESLKDGGEKDNQVPSF